MIKDAIMESAYEVLGMKERKKRNGWFDSDCEKAIRQSNKAYKRYIQRETRERGEVYDIRRQETDKLCRQGKEDLRKS